MTHEHEWVISSNRNRGLYAYCTDLDCNEELAGDEIRSRVDALEGLNPEAVGPLIEAAKQVREFAYHSGSGYFYHIGGCLSNPGQTTCICGIDNLHVKLNQLLGVE